jgi:hypothetical protein
MSARGKDRGRGRVESRSSEYSATALSSDVRRFATQKCNKSKTMARVFNSLARGWPSEASAALLPMEKIAVQGLAFSEASHLAKRDEILASRATDRYRVQHDCPVNLYRPRRFASFISDDLMWQDARARARSIGRALKVPEDYAFTWQTVAAVMTKSRQVARPPRIILRKPQKTNEASNLHASASQRLSARRTDSSSRGQSWVLGIKADAVWSCPNTRCT